MKSKLTILLLAFSFFICNSQEKITEFTTIYANVGSGSIKMEVKFELYTDKLVLNYSDKNTIKTMKKNGLEPFIVFPYPFEMEKNDYSLIYKFQDDNLQIIVMLEGNPKPSVSIKTKDSFTGNMISSQLYFSL